MKKLKGNTISFKIKEEKNLYGGDDSASSKNSKRKSDKKKGSKNGLKNAIKSIKNAVNMVNGLSSSQNQMSKVGITDVLRNPQSIENSIDNLKEEPQNHGLNEIGLEKKPIIIVSGEDE